MHKHTILIIEDESDLRVAMQALLEAEYNVAVADNGFTGLKYAVRSPPDLILMDLKMPTMDGFEACRLFRADSELNHVPVFIVSGFATDSEKARARDLGANEFIAKPFDFSELKLRIKLYLPDGDVIAPSSATFSTSLKLGSIEMDLAKSTVVVNQQSVHLSLLEFRLLQLLIANQGRLVSRETIIQKVWAGEEVSTKIMAPHFVALRSKIQGSGYEIASVYGKGYLIRPHIV